MTAPNSQQPHTLTVPAYCGSGYDGEILHVRVIVGAMVNAFAALLLSLTPGGSWAAWFALLAVPTVTAQLLRDHRHSLREAREAIEHCHGAALREEALRAIKRQYGIS
jgi:hypothetical protein